MDATRIRIRFSKEGDLRLISHRDLVRVWERLFRRAELPLAMSTGFHPKPRMSFPSALGLGITGREEIMLVYLSAHAEVQDLQSRLAACAPPGLIVGEVTIDPPGAAKPQVETMTYELAVPPDRQAATAAAIAQLDAAATYDIHREGRKAPLEMKSLVRDLSLNDGALTMQIAADRGGTVRPDEILQALNLSDLLEEGFPLTRSKVEVSA